MTSPVDYLVSIVQSCIAPNYIPAEIIKQAKEIESNLYTKQDFLNAAEFCEVSMIDAKYIISRIDEARQKNK